MDELDRILRRMGAREVADRSLRRVMAGLGSLPEQRRPWWRAWALPDFSLPQAVTLATAVTVGVILGMAAEPSGDLAAQLFDAQPRLGLE